MVTSRPSVKFTDIGLLGLIVSQIKLDNPIKVSEPSSDNIDSRDNTDTVAFYWCGGISALVA